MASVISFRIDDEDKDMLQKFASDYDVTVSWVARRAIKQYLARQSITNITKEYENENSDGLHLKGDEAIGGERTYTDCDDTQS